jgi:outer membrane receptor protein involved in Fe transport
MLVAISAMGETAMTIDGDTMTVTIDELTVTAIKNPSALGLPGVSGTVLGRGTVERDRVLTVRDATLQVPNFFIPEYGSRMTSTIYVRGLGTRIDQPAVGLNIDNIPVLCKENYDVDMMDITRIEMLRGPQSTLYGRNTVGGLMNVYTLSPLSYQGTRALAQWGSHRSGKVGLSHYRLLGNHWALGASGYYTRSGGQWRNNYNGELADWERQGSARVKVEWAGDNQWRVSNVAQASVSRQGGYPYEWVKTGQVAYNDTCFYRRTSVMDGLTVSKRMERVDLSSITSYQYLDDNMTLDQDFTPQPYFTLTQKRREHAVTQDVVARHTGDKYSWLVGAFGYYRRMTMNAPVTFKDTGIGELIENHRNMAAPSYPIAWDSREFLLGSDFVMPTGGAALYHQSTLKHDRWQLTAGVRLDYEHAGMRYHSYTNTGYNILVGATGEVMAHEAIDIDDRGRLHQDFFEVLPRVTLSYQLGGNDRNAVWLTASRGSKAGGFNTQMFSDVLQQRLMGMMGIGARYDVDKIVSYRPEKAWNFEAGTHWQGTWHGNVSIDASVFWMDCHDRQLTVFPDGTTTGRVMTNAGHTRNVGGELSATWASTGGTEVSVSYGYTSARFLDYNDGKADYRHRHVPYSPDNTLHCQVSHELDITGDWADAITLEAHLDGTGRIYWNEANTLSQPFYTLLGTSATLRGKHYNVQLWANNLCDTGYKTFYFVSIGHEFLQRGRGREAGVTLRLDF